MPGRRRSHASANTAQSEPVTGRQVARRQQNRTRWGGRPPEGWFPIDEGTPLQVLLKTQMTRLGEPGPPLSTHEVAHRSGDLVSANTVSLLIRGQTSRPSDRTITGLAKALDVPEGDIRTAIAASDHGITLQLPKRAAKLSPAAWSDLLSYLDFLLQRDGRG